MTNSSYVRNFRLKWHPLLPCAGNVVMTDSPNTVVNIKSVDQTSNCTVCTNIDGCSSQTTFKLLSSVSVDFTCPEPQMVFTVEINRDVGERSLLSSGPVALVGEAPVWHDVTVYFGYSIVEL